MPLMPFTVEIVTAVTMFTSGLSLDVRWITLAPFRGDEEDWGCGIQTEDTAPSCHRSSVTAAEPPKQPLSPSQTSTPGNNLLR